MLEKSNRCTTTSWNELRLHGMEFRGIASMNFTHREMFGIMKEMLREHVLRIQLFKHTRQRF